MSEPMAGWTRHPRMSVPMRRKLDALVQRLPLKVAKELAADSTQSRYEPGSVLFYRDHVPYGSYLLLRGSVSLDMGHGSRMGRGVIVEAPTLLGYRQAADRHPSPVTARAVTTALVCHISGYVDLKKYGLLKQGEAR